MPSKPVGGEHADAIGVTVVVPPKPSCFSLDGTDFWKRSAIFLKLALPGAAMLGFEAWTFEAQTLLSGLLGTVSLNAQATLLNIITITWMAGPLAIGIAASIKVGHAIGSGSATDARSTARAASSVVLV